MILGSLIACASNSSLGHEEASDEPGRAAGQHALDPQSAAPCSEMDEEACQDSDDCQVVRGSAVILSPGRSPEDPVYCVMPRAVVGCIVSQECAEELTYFCNERGEVMEVTNACGPAGWAPCPLPGPLQGSCTQ